MTKSKILVVLGVAVFVSTMTLHAATTKAKSTGSEVQTEEGKCKEILTRKSTLSNKGNISVGYAASNAAMHRCLYVQEMAAAKILPAIPVVNYENWTKQHPDFSPNLPREKFIQAFDARHEMLRGLKAME